MFSKLVLQGFVANLASTWPQHGVQDGSKIDEKSIRNGIIFSMSFLMEFILILGRFGVGFAGHVGLQNR